MRTKEFLICVIVIEIFTLALIFVFYNSLPLIYNKNLPLVNESNLIEEIIFDDYWYRWENISTNETMRWMPKKASIYIFSQDNDTVKLNFTLTPYKEGPLKIFVNDKIFIDTYLNTSSSISIESIDIVKGMNKITIEGECKVPALIENSTDNRCLSFALTNFRR